jgi:hypothetical protein
MSTCSHLWTLVFPEIPHYWNDRASPPDMPSPDLLIKQSGVSLVVLAVVANSGLMIVGDEETGTVEGGERARSFMN